MRKILMTKILALAIVGILICGNVYADRGLTANASPVAVDIIGMSAGASDRTIIYKNITFPYKTRDLIIRNNHASNWIYVDVKSATNTRDINSCYRLAPETSLELYDFLTDGISLLYASSPVVASDISVMSVY